MDIERTTSDSVSNLLAFHYEQKTPIASRFYGAKIGRGFVGFISVSSPTFASCGRDALLPNVDKKRIERISRIVVKPRYQKRGIGSLLVERVLSVSERDYVEVIAKARLESWFVSMGFETHVYTRKNGDVMVYAVKKVFLDYDSFGITVIIFTGSLF